MTHRDLDAESRRQTLRPHLGWCPFVLCVGQLRKADSGDKTWTKQGIADAYSNILNESCELVLEMNCQCVSQT